MNMIQIWMQRNIQMSSCLGGFMVRVRVEEGSTELTAETSYAEEVVTPE